MWAPEYVMAPELRSRPGGDGFDVWRAARNECLVGGYHSPVVGRRLRVSSVRD
jgi:hypothetical protein